MLLGDSEGIEDLAGGDKNVVGDEMGVVDVKARVTCQIGGRIAKRGSKKVFPMHFHVDLLP